MNNSIVYGYDFEIVYREYFPEDTLKIDVNSSAYDSTRVVEGEAAGTPGFTVQGLVELNTVDPMFKDPANGDYSLKAGSPLIDVGQAADPAPVSLDFVGNQRACHGTAAGVIRRDIGAFEFKTDPAGDCTYSTTSIGEPQGAATSKSRTFTFTASKPGSTYLCSLDGTAFVACPMPHTTSGLSAGPHELKVKAKDVFGNIQFVPTSKSLQVVAPSCANDPSLCPDKTAPKVTDLKAPKNTAAARAKVRFGSNEKVVTFKCKLNGAGWKKSRSPWKTPKLRKGKNTIRIQATDKAGNKSKVVKRVIRKTVRRK